MINIYLYCKIITTVSLGHSHCHTALWAATELCVPFGIRRKEGSVHGGYLDCKEWFPDGCLRDAAEPDRLRNGAFWRRAYFSDFGKGIDQAGYLPSLSASQRERYSIFDAMRQSPFPRQHGAGWRRCAGLLIFDLQKCRICCFLCEIWARFTLTIVKKCGLC